MIFKRPKLLSRSHLLTKMQQHADENARQLSHDIEMGIEKHRPKKILVLTHVPPFPELFLYEGKQTDDNYFPYFASKATGEVLLEAEQNHPFIEFVTLCGHTHHYSERQMIENLRVIVGDAEYYQPSVQEIITL
jgi:hypothetical protein